MKDIITDSLRYWEPRRIAFNAVLGLVVAGSILGNQPSFADLARLSWQPLVGLLLAAVLANVLYCAAYAVDLMVQLSDYQALWRRHRWILWIAGTVLAAAVYLFHD